MANPRDASPPLAPARLLHDEQGATAIEYGLIAALVGTLLIAALLNMRAMMDGLYAVVDTINDVM